MPGLGPVSDEIAHPIPAKRAHADAQALGGSAKVPRIRVKRSHNSPAFSLLTFGEPELILRSWHGVLPDGSDNGLGMPLHGLGNRRAAMSIAK